MSHIKSVQSIVLYAIDRPEDLLPAIEYIKGIKHRALQNGETYILDIKCGTTRPAAPIRSSGFNLASILEFRTQEDKVYFEKQDPAHLDIIEYMESRLSKDVMIVQFIDGRGEMIATDAC